MKKILLSFLILTATFSFAGGFIFPNVEYSYARLYLFNTQPPTDNHFYDFDIYRDGKYAYSKIGNGWEVSDELVQKMNGVFRIGVDVMVMGLTGCYIPRHGIIFFDDLGKPVASFTACFECERIGFWSSVPLPTFKGKYSEKSAKIAEKQFDDLIVILESYKIPVFKQEPEYSQFADDDSLYSCDGEIIFDYKEDTDFTKGKFKTTDAKSWILKTSNFHLNESIDTIYRRNPDRDGANTPYTKLSHKGGTEFGFWPITDGALIAANINNPAIVLPNGVSVGMSLEQVQASIGVYDGIAYPSSIIAVYPHLSIRYFIERRTLVRIELVFS